MGQLYNFHEQGEEETIAITGLGMYIPAVLPVIHV